MFRTKWLQPLLLLAVTSCASGQTGSAGFRLAAHPIRPATADMQVISDSLVQQILTHDRTGQHLCGWKP